MHPASNGIKHIRNPTSDSQASTLAEREDIQRVRDPETQSQSSMVELMELDRKFAERVLMV